jgi:hypothetical protein
MIATITPIAIHQFSPANETIQKTITFDEQKNNPTLKTIIYENKTYKYDYFSTNKFDSVLVGSNLVDKKTSSDIFSEEKCNSLTSGGFYDTNDNPIGLFKINNYELSASQQNKLFNGYVHINNPKDITILLKPNDSYKNIIQTGPVLIFDQIIQELSMKTDQQKRRIVAAKNDQNTFFFIIISEDSLFEGPLLAELPFIMGNISQKEKLSLTHAINLDGGSASTFHTKNIHIKEISSIGSYICFK